MDPLLNPAFLVFASLSPLLAALLKQAGFSSRVNALIALAVYVGVGIAGALTAGVPLSIETMVTFISSAALVGTVAYQLFWKNMGEPQLVEATSVVKG